jgi:MinD-like ATPase involved in chromosome partitioning or flagellar assembly
MCLILSVYSFRRGTGKSKLIANLAALACSQGLRVGVVDLNFQSPSIHLLFGLPQPNFAHTLNDYVAERCEIEDCCYDITAAVMGPDAPGRLVLIPASDNLATISATLRQGFEMVRLNMAFAAICREQELDFIFLDNPAGLGETSLLAQALSDATLIVLRPDKQDYQGTDLMVGVSRELGVPRILMLVNELPAAFKAEEIKRTVEASFGCPVTAVIPYSDDMMSTPNDVLFVHYYPNHPITHKLQTALQQLISIQI